MLSDQVQGSGFCIAGGCLWPYGAWNLLHCVHPCWGGRSLIAEQGLVQFLAQHMAPELWVVKACLDNQVAVLAGKPW